MKIAVMGAGGVGGFYGGLLAKAGNHVTFIARGAHLAALQANGLKVESQSLGDFALPRVKATADPATIGPIDFVLFTPKAFDLESAALSLLPILRADTTVLPLLNGVDIAERLVGTLGKERVLDGMVQVAAFIAAPGVIRQMGAFNKIFFGEMAGGTSPRAKALLAAFQAAGIPAELSEQIRVDVWKKYVFISAAAGMASLTRSTIGPVMKDLDTRAMAIDVIEEVAGLARKKGIALPSTIVADTLAVLDRMPAGGKPSMLLSLEQGKALELDAIHGTAVWFGKELGVPTPLCQFIVTALKLHAAGHP
jgi:2-dehydropantoate 2-reductase